MADALKEQVDELSRKYAAAGFPPDEQKRLWEEMNRKQKAFEESEIGKKFRRVDHVGIYLESIAHSLDSFDDVDTDWFYERPETGVVERPSLAYRMATTKRNLWEFLRRTNKIIERLYNDADGKYSPIEFDGSREIVVCVQAVYTDILPTHDIVVEEQDWAFATGYQAAIKEVKEVFERAQWTFRETLLLLSARALMEARRIRSEAGMPEQSESQTDLDGMSLSSPLSAADCAYWFFGTKHDTARRKFTAQVRAGTIRAKKVGRQFRIPIADLPPKHPEAVKKTDG